VFNDLDWNVVFQSPGRDMLLSGLWVTLQLSVLGIVLATVLGTVVALGRVTTSHLLRPLRWLLTGYVEFVRNVPLVVQLLFWGFGMFSLELVRSLTHPINGLFSNQFLAGLCGLAVYTSSYIAEVLRSGLQSVPRGQMEAARASGLGYVGAMRHVVLPQVFRLVLPALGNQYIGLTKNTSVVLFIGVADLVFQAQQIEATTFRAFEAFTAVIVIFAALCLTEAALLSLVSRRSSRRRNARLGFRLRPTPALLEQPE
jgi:His/Glu/Gln/Arg/opine family amino acid ABC transporter permease subunit